MDKLRVMILAAIVSASMVSCVERPYQAAAPTTPVYNSKTIGTVTFQWHVNGANLECILSSPYTGWMAVAFNSGSTLHMAGGNILIGYVDGTGAHMSDQNMTVLPHTPDAQQDISNISGTETASGTELHFTIPLNSGDPNDVVLVPGQQYNIFMAASSSDDITVYHDERGMGQITL